MHNFSMPLHQKILTNQWCHNKKEEARQWSGYTCMLMQGVHLYIHSQYAQRQRCYMQTLHIHILHMILSVDSLFDPIHNLLIEGQHPQTEDKLILLLEVYSSIQHL